MDEKEITRRIKRVILDEFEMNYRNGLYKIVQIELAYNSNKIEGSSLTEEETLNMFETGLFVEDIRSNEDKKVNDIIEMQNHFLMFNFMLKTLDEKLSEKLIKELHMYLKANSKDVERGYAVGNYKTISNKVSNITTASPFDVGSRMNDLIDEYNKKSNKTLDDIVEFHVDYETIHPFQDGNGRTGRIIMFRECLRNDIFPFVIKDNRKQSYYQGLTEYRNNNTKFLINFCKEMQDVFLSFALDYLPKLSQKKSKSR